MVGEGAFAHKHLDALTRIGGVEVVSIASGVAEHAQAAAGKYGHEHRRIQAPSGAVCTLSLSCDKAGIHRLDDP